MKRTAWLFFAVIVFSAARLLPQKLDNLNVYYSLIDRSVAKIDSAINVPKENFFVRLSIPQPLDQLSSKIILAFRQKGYKIKEENDGPSVLNYVLIDTKVSYKNPYKDGFFGDVLADREVKLNGSYFLAANTNIGEPVYFNLTHNDTVVVDEIPNLESKSLPFTQGEQPQPPLLSNLLEPAIVIGALITTIILFFTVRSK